MQSNASHTSPFNRAVLIAGLGFFVDAFDLLLFNVLRIPSLSELGFSGAELTRNGETLLAIQMAGMMLGGIGSGMLADRFGRASVLFGSILLYSLANLANAFVSSYDMYAVLRFVAGLGLAGELGAGIAMVGERMHAEKRGLGTILVATLGGLGAVAAGLSGDLLHWRTAYIVAGVMGLLLLLLRVKGLETELFHQARKNASIRRGNFFDLFRKKERRNRFLRCVFAGIPIWYCVGMLVSFAPDLAREHGLTGIRLGTCFVLFQTGIACGDLSSGLLSQYFRSRRKIILGFMLLALCVCVLWFAQFYISNFLSFSLLSLFMGLGCGYLSVFVTTTSEQFGTNLRVTATSSATNLMRGSIAVLVPLHFFLVESIGLSRSDSLAAIGIIVWAAALYAVHAMNETFGKSLDFVEQE
jgi:putative MFS transporter